jgi:hypothetical protein
VQIQEHYNGKPIGVNGTLKCGAGIAGFLPTVSGTLTATDADGTVLVNAVPVTAGVYVKIPLGFHTSSGGSVTLAGGAAGTLFA